MKKLMMVAAVLLLAVPAVQAQRVNKDAILSKLVKSDADAADAKKNTKASTWISRGKTYFEAAAEPTKTLFGDMDAAMLKLTVGDAQAQEQATIGKVDYDVMVFPYFKAYVRDGKVKAWEQTQEVQAGLIDEAIVSYAKAYELDPKSAERIKGGLKQISDYCSQLGNVNLELTHFKAAADAYAAAYKAQAVPAYGKADPELLYYAGYLETVNGANDPHSFTLGAEYLKKAIAEGYEGKEAQDGLAYYYLFHCYYGRKAESPENLQLAKQALLDGLERYPKSERLLDGLMSLYTAEKDMGDPADLIAMIEDAIARDPENVDMWFGRGRIFAALKNNDECIASFKRVTELAPEMYDGYFWTGYFYVEKANVLNSELEAKPWTGEAAYLEELKVVNSVYMQAVAWFEKALEIKPNDLNSVDYLKSVSYRLRDEEGMADKYAMYDKMFKALQQ